MKKFFTYSGITIGVIALIILIAWGTGGLNILYTKTIGKDQQNAQTTVFHQTQGYVDGAVSDISKVKLEYDQSNDTTAKEGLINYVRTNYSNLDPSLINNLTIRAWLQHIQDGTVK